MLTQEDVAWIRSNRDEITASRTEPVIITHETDGAVDPYTGEPTKVTTTETVEVVWKEIKALRDGDLRLIGGEALQVGDVAMTLPPDTEVANITLVKRNDVNYRIIAHDERGIGGKNRYECVVRRVT